MLMNISRLISSLLDFQNIFFTCKTGKGCGIEVHFSKSLSVSLFNANFAATEVLAFEIARNSLEAHLLEACRPPSESAPTFVVDLREVIRADFSVCILCTRGNINIHLFKPERSSAESYLNTLAGCGIEALIHETIIEEFMNGNLSSTCIDHVNIRASDLSSVTGAVITQKLADHYFIACRMTKKDCVPQVGSSKHHVTILDKTRFDKEIASFEWDSCIRQNSAHAAYDKLVLILKDFKEACQRK